MTRKVIAKRGFKSAQEAHKYWEGHDDPGQMTIVPGIALRPPPPQAPKDEHSEKEKAAARKTKGASPDRPMPVPGVHPDDADPMKGIMPSAVKDWCPVCRFQNGWKGGASDGTPHLACMDYKHLLERCECSARNTNRFQSKLEIARRNRERAAKGECPYHYYECARCLAIDSLMPFNQASGGGYARTTPGGRQLCEGCWRLRIYKQERNRGYIRGSPRRPLEGKAGAAPRQAVDGGAGDAGRPAVEGPHGGAHVGGGVDAPDPSRPVLVRGPMGFADRLKGLARAGDNGGAGQG